MLVGLNYLGLIRDIKHGNYEFIIKKQSSNHPLLQLRK